MNDTKPTRLIVGLTGATGTIFGVRLLQMLHGSGVETHLVMSAAARQTIAIETDYAPHAVEALADTTYRINDTAAAISSGSYQTIGMVVIPCSMKTPARCSACFQNPISWMCRERSSCSWITMNSRKP